MQSKVPNHVRPTHITYTGLLSARGLLLDGSMDGLARGFSGTSYSRWGTGNLGSQLLGPSPLAWHDPWPIYLCLTLLYASMYISLSPPVFFDRLAGWLVFSFPLCWPFCLLPAVIHNLQKWMEEKWMGTQFKSRLPKDQGQAGLKADKLVRTSV